MISVLLVDDHGPVMKSFRLLLGAAEDIQVVSTASNGVDAVDKACSYCPDVVVMDISMPLMNGIEATKYICECCRLTRVLLVSCFDIPGYIMRGLAAGAKGYVLKDTMGEDLLKAIHAIHRGSEYFSEKIAQIATAYLGHKGNDKSAV